MATKKVAKQAYVRKSLIGETHHGQPVKNSTPSYVRKPEPQFHTRVYHVFLTPGSFIEVRAQFLSQVIGEISKMGFDPQDAYCVVRAV